MIKVNFGFAELFWHQIFEKPYVFFLFWQRNYESTKILRNLRLHFARQDGQNGKKRKEGHATKVTKYQKPKDKKYGMNET